MDISNFLAKALGLYLFVISLSMFINTSQFKTMIHDISYNPAFLFLTGIMTLIIGILLVISHNVWQSDWRVVITIIAWLSLFKGIIRVMFPNLVSEWIKKFMQNNIVYYVIAIMTFLLGIFLSYCGFI